MLFDLTHRPVDRTYLRNNMQRLKPACQRLAAVLPHHHHILDARAKLVRLAGIHLVAVVASAPWTAWPRQRRCDA